MGGVPAASIKKAIIDSCGIISQAARVVGLSRVQVTRRINKSKQLQDALKEAREIFIDEGESALISAVKAKEHWAVSLLLKTLGKDRGYIEKTELGVEGDITVKVVKFGDNDTK